MSTIGLSGVAARLRKALELSEFSRRVFAQGLRRRFPDRSEGEIHEIMLDRLASRRVVSGPARF